MRLCLIRHFEPDIAPGICYGQTDLALKTPVHDESARVDSLREELVNFVNEEPPIFTSTLQRCSMLAAALSPGFVADARLCELNFGAWEMQSWDAIGPLALDAWASNIAGYRPFNGETGYELQQRALDWLREISPAYDCAVAVTHAGVMRALQAHHQRLPGVQWLDLRYEYGELLCLDFTAEQIYAAPVQ